MFTIKVDSIVDIITNSSSELFVGKTERSIESIKEILIDILNLHNKINETTLEFDNIFDSDIHYFGKHELDIIEGYGLGYSIPSIHRFERNRGLKYGEGEKLWHEMYDEKLMVENKDKLCIYSASDNTIPYSMWEMIEDLFTSVNRIHSG